MYALQVQGKADILLSDEWMPDRSVCRDMKIYTKGGDEGVASLYNGERCAKDSAVFDALGDVDELNSVLGMASEHTQALESTIVEQVCNAFHLLSF